MRLHKDLLKRRNDADQLKSTRVEKLLLLLESRNGRRPHAALHHHRNRLLGPMYTNGEVLGTLNARPLY